VNFLLQISVMAPYWLVNRTGLPLIFRQDGISQEFAGQSHEHEIGRSVEPLLFSLSDPAAPPLLVARVGKELHPNGTPQVS
jgi:vacuolar protein sorting-associated protein 13D